MSPRNCLPSMGAWVQSTTAPHLFDSLTGQKLTMSNDKKSTEGDTVELDKSKVDFTAGGVDKYKFYPDNPQNHRHKYRYSMKEPSKYYDPCEETRQASINCMIRHPEDKKAMCQDFFDAYKECKRDFYNKKRQDRREGKKGWGVW